VTPPRYDAAYLQNPPPAYPLVAERFGYTGKVLVRVLVTPQGNPASVTIEQSSGITSLDNAALRAIRGWKFIPARDGNRPIQAEVLVPVDFHNKDKDK
jgi:protein TonB